MKEKLIRTFCCRKTALLPILMLGILFTHVHLVDAKRNEEIKNQVAQAESLEAEKDVTLDAPLEQEETKKIVSEPQTAEEPLEVEKKPDEPAPKPKNLETKNSDPVPSAKPPVSKAAPPPTPAPAPTPAPTPTPAPAPTPTPTPVPPSQVSQIISLINIERSKMGLSPARENSLLNSAASAKAKHMSQNNYFAHTAPDGTPDVYFVNQAGYRYRAIGFNLAKGNFASNQALVDAWMNSAGHRANILASFGQEIGVGIYANYYVMMIAQPL